MELVSALLIVEDDAVLARTLSEALRSRASIIRCAGTLAEACRELEQTVFDVVLLDVSLPDGRAEGLLPALRDQRPSARVIAMSGEAEPEEAFALAQHGVRAFLKKPLDLEQLEFIWDESLRRPPELEPFVRSSVGRVPLQALEESLRSTMLDEALARAGGNRRAAARLLQVSRQLLQHMLKR